MRRELPRVPAEVAAYAESTTAYLEREPRPLVVQALVVMILMFGLGRFSAGALSRLEGEEGTSRARRLLERPYSIGLLLGLLASPLIHPLAPRRFMQLMVLIALAPAARILTHAAERVRPIAFAGPFALILLDRLGLALGSLPALARVTS